jgi:hypothetical protein
MPMSVLLPDIAAFQRAWLSTQPDMPVGISTTTTSTSSTTVTRQQLHSSGQEQDNRKPQV